MTKPATIKDIAKALDLSVSTVSKALNNHPNIGSVTKERVRKLAASMNYVPNKLAIRFKQQRTYTLGIIVPTLLDHFYTLVVNGVEEQAASSGYHVLIGQHQERLQRERDLVEIMRGNGIDGLLIAISRETLDIGHLKVLQDSGIPVVFFARKPINESHHCVSSNVYQAATEAIALLLSRGHRTIGFINGPHVFTTSRDRFLGYRDGLQQAKLPLLADLVQESDLSTDGNELALRKLMSLKERPTALLIFKDYVMLDVMSCLRTEFPDAYKQIELIGYGALPLFKHFEHPPLASLKEQPQEIGKASCSIIVDLIYQPELQKTAKLISIPCELYLF